MSFVLSLTLAMYVMSGMLSLAHSVRRRVRLFRVSALAVLAVGVVVNLLWVMTRWQSAGFPPFAELYGCLVLLALCVGVVSLSLELLVDVRFVGALSSLAAAGVLVFSVRYLGETRPLPPALQSPYFAPHVLSYFIAYGALSVAGLASLVLLVARLFGVGAPSADEGRRFLEGVEAWIDRSAQIGLPFLTLGLILGGFWAQAAYTDYWSWDPKEVWALITWLLVVAWFHLRMSSRRPVLHAALMLVAVAALYFTLLGMGLLPTAEQSVHTYTQP